MDSKVKVSIITPLYNSERFVKECLESVLKQTYNNWEMLIVDDCSTDKSAEIVNQYLSRDKRFKYFKLNNNSGAGVARNKAILEAKGDIIAFLDSDDIWLAKKLEEHVNFMEKNNAAFSHTSYGFINERGDVINKTFRVSKKPVFYVDLLKRTEISCLTAMYDVRKIGKMYMPDIRRKQDYALWLAILKKGIASIPLDSELAFYRQSKESATNNKIKLVKKHYVFLRGTQNINILKSIYYTFYWGVNGFIKYYINRF